MAVRRLTRRESKRARANWAAVRAAGEKVLLEWLFGFEQCDVPALNRAELDEIRHNLGRFGAVRDGVVLPGRSATWKQEASHTPPESTGSY